MDKDSEDLNLTSTVDSDFIKYLDIELPQLNSTKVWASKQW